MNRPDEEPPPNERKLRIASFAIHAPRGLLRDRQRRRQVVFWTVIVAVVMLLLGATFLAPIIDPCVWPGWFILYWLACAWMTVMAVLLALFDLLQVQAEKRCLAEEIRKQAEEGDGA